ncbi:hypothetical protein AB0C34_27855 [Nocardia sp. NPDC049220]|uniref:hypothetical protein n=1 Tax=Nocardia sp. NPDC049220 TaxID=3155273 RepID=UPI0033E635C5
MKNQRLVEPENWESLSSNNAVYLLRSTDGALNIYKPISGERLGRYGIPNVHGEYAKREVAAFRVDEILGFGLVPPTAMIDGPRGRGSLQQFVPSTEARAPWHYEELQRQQMAVLDYIIGNTDRHSGNYRTCLNGRLLATDHGSSFPEKLNHFSSDFLHMYKNKSFDADVMKRLGAVDPDHLRLALEEVGLSRTAIDGALERFYQVRGGGIPDVEVVTHYIVP